MVFLPYKRNIGMSTPEVFVGLALAVSAIFWAMYPVIFGRSSVPKSLVEHAHILTEGFDHVYPHSNLVRTRLDDKRLYVSTGIESVPKWARDMEIYALPGVIDKTICTVNTNWYSLNVKCGSVETRYEYTESAMRASVQVSCWAADRRTAGLMEVTYDTVNRRLQAFDNGEVFCQNPPVKYIY